MRNGMQGIVEPLGLPAQGARKRADGTTEWCVWAPRHKQVTLALWENGRPVPRSMRAGDRGHFFWQGSAVAGQRYAYRLGTEARDLPDPASHWQPEGVHRPSAVFAADEFSWTDVGWRGVKQDELVIYELHVGTFTPAGTFAAIVERLPQLVELGITAIEIMPVAQFSGGRNWGYDGVHPNAAQNSYGGPAGLQALVNAAHQAGMGVLLDVVYNHLGPEGNYFDLYGPYFTDRYHTPWGKALNYDGPDCDAVRKLVIDNAVMWVRDFHVDGLRLDAVQTIYDTSAKHILEELQDAVQDEAARQGRRVVVIAETDQNDVRLVAPTERGGYGLDGVWADDFHHTVHTLLTGEREGYYVDFGAPEQIAKALRDVFVYDGRFSPFRQRRVGNHVGDTPRERFVFCIQNHDQVGNRVLGDRFGELLPAPAQRLAASLLLLSPAVPMLFMGEEYGETRPFPFFCSFADGGLIEAVRRGRRAEMESVKIHWKHEPPDPQSPSTFDEAKLSWSWTDEPQRAGLRALYADLLRARRAWPPVAARSVAQAEILYDGEAACLCLALGSGATLHVRANLSSSATKLPLPPVDAVPLFSSALKAYGGTRSLDAAIATLEPYECVAWGQAAWGRADLKT